MARNTRTSAQRLKDLEIIEDMYLAGKSQYKIAEVIGVSRQQVGYDIEELRQRWIARTAMKIDQKKAEELAKIDRLEQEYWMAWQESRKEFKANTVRKAEGKAKTAEVSQHTENRYGDARFLQGIAWCISKRCEILGLNAPTEIKGAITAEHEWTDTQLKRLARHIIRSKNATEA
jgi:hypothetical protein